MRVIKEVGREPLALVGMGVVLLIVCVALFAEQVAPYDPLKVNLPNRLQPLNEKHLLGTDNLGRDILSRIIYGARIDLSISLIVVSIALSIGVALGAIAGYFRGGIGAAIMRMVDIFLSIPYLLFAMAISAALGSGLQNTAIALIVPTMPVYARLMYGQVLLLSENDYVEAARALGASKIRILVCHIILNAIYPLIVQASIDIGNVIMWASSLSFIGLGAQPPTPEWGAMVSLGRHYLRLAWWYPTFPGLAIFLTVMGFNLMGDGIRDIFDPRLR